MQRKMFITTALAALITLSVVSPPVTAFSDWIGAYAIIDKYGNSGENTATMHDPELEAMLKAIPGQTDEAKVNELMRKVYTRLRSESLGIGLVNVHTPYAVSKKLANWNPGSVMYDLNLDQLTAAATN